MYGPIFTEPAENKDPNSQTHAIQVARNLKFRWVTVSGVSWSAVFRIEVWTVQTNEFLGGIFQAGAGVGGHDPYPLLAQTARDLWPDHV